MPSSRPWQLFLITIATGLPATAAVFLKERQELCLDVLEGGLQTIRFIDRANLGFHRCGLSPRRKELIRGHLNEDFRALLGRDIFLFQDPFPCIEGEYGIADPCLAAFFFFGQEARSFLQSCQRDRIRWLR